MIRRSLACLLLTGLTWGQATNSKPAAPPAPAANGAATPQAEPAKVAPDAAVITIQGLCSNPPADKATSPDCKTIVTREQFENIVNAVAPKMPSMAKKQFANRYALGLVMSKEAEREGVDKTPKYDQMMTLMRIQVMQQLLSQTVQEKAGQVSDKDISDYYEAHKSNYDEADLLKVAVPRSKQSDTPMDSMSDEAQKTQDDASEAAMKKEVEEIHKRAVAGEDFTKLQADAYKAAAIKNSPPNTSVGKLRRSGLPPQQASVIDLKVGEVSAVIEDAGGYEIYKVVSKDTLPLDKVTDEIRNTLRSQKAQEMMQSIQKSATPVLNDAYFGGPGAAPGPGGPMGGPMGGPGKPPAKPNSK